MAKLPASDVLIQAFLTRYKVETSYAHNEIALRQLTTWLDDQRLGHIATMSAPHFDLYADHLKTAGLRSETLRNKLGSIKRFFDYLVSSGTLKESPVPEGWVPRPSRGYGHIDEPLLSEDQIQGLFDAAARHRRPHDVQTLIALAGFDGIKGVHIHRLEAEDVRFSGPQAIVPIRRGAESVHNVPLSDQTSALLAAVVRDRPTGPLIYGSFKRRGDRTKAVNRDLRAVVAEAGIGLKVNTRVLEKSYRKNMLEAGVRLDVLIERLGFAPDNTNMKSLVPKHGPGTAGEAAIAQAVRQSDATELLRQAENLCDQPGVTPIAPIVIAGAALEMVLRSMCEIENVALSVKKPGIDAYSQALRSRSLISKHEHATNQANGKLRNDAAHGLDSPDLTIAKARLMIGSVLIFISDADAAD